jgi:hypothetical protein
MYCAGKQKGPNMVAFYLQVQLYIGCPLSQSRQKGIQHVEMLFCEQDLLLLFSPFF